MQPDVETRKVFISYSWSDQPRVLNIVKRLLSSGIDVVMDVYDLEPGKDKYQFMERSVNDPSVDYVLIFSSKVYAQKADSREGGVGDEAQILSKDAYDCNKNKVQVILLERDENKSECVPAYLNTKKYFDFSSPAAEQLAFEELVRFLYDKPLFKKPALGPRPSYLDEEKVDLFPLREELSRLPVGGTRRFSRFIDEVAKKIHESIFEADIDIDNYLEYYGQLQNIREVCVDYAVRYYENDGRISDLSKKLIEAVVNCCPIGMPEIKIDLVRSFAHELLICMVAIILYYDELEDLRALLSYKFEMKSPYRTGSIFVTYSGIYHYSNVFEQINRKDQRKRVCLHADQMVSRQQYPYITRETLSTADLVMYHLRPMLSMKEHYWFPLLYVYFDGGIKLWARLESKSYLEAFEEIFSIEEKRLIDLISNNPYRDRMRHTNSWDEAPWISAFIDVDKIGKDA